MNWCENSTIALIELWKNYECLYNAQCNEYHNKHARGAALETIAKELEVFSPTINASDVKQKIVYLRGQYTREVAKRKNRKSGSSTDEVYVPSAFWFNHLTFLDDFIKVRKGRSNFVMDVEDSENSEEFLTPQTSKMARMHSDVSCKNNTAEDNVLEAAVNVLHNITERCNVNRQDEAFANYIATELVDITDEGIKCKVKQAIIKAIFDGKEQNRNSQFL